MIGIGKGGQREIDDIALTRYACYLIAQNGDPANRPLADFLPTLTIKAKDFATELTSHNVIDNLYIFR